MYIILVKLLYMQQFCNFQVLDYFKWWRWWAYQNNAISQTALTTNAKDIVCIQLRCFPIYNSWGQKVGTSMRQNVSSCKYWEKGTFRIGEYLVFLQFLEIDQLIFIWKLFYNWIIHRSPIYISPNTPYLFQFIFQSLKTYFIINDFVILSTSYPL